MPLVVHHRRLGGAGPRRTARRTGPAAVAERTPTPRLRPVGEHPGGRRRRRRRRPQQPVSTVARTGTEGPVTSSWDVGAGPGAPHLPADTGRDPALGGLGDGAALHRDVIATFLGRFDPNKGEHHERNLRLHRIAVVGCVADRLAGTAGRLRFLEGYERSLQRRAVYVAAGAERLRRSPDDPPGGAAPAAPPGDRRSDARAATSTCRGAVDCSCTNSPGHPGPRP